MYTDTLSIEIFFIWEFLKIGVECTQRERVFPADVFHTERHHQVGSRSQELI